ncbi:hypothetical protein ACK3TF_003224 [Chlorella vulgaris]
MAEEQASDLERLQTAEKKLLSALEAAQQVASLLGQGGSRQELERLCSAFVEDARESQLSLLQLAEKHERPLPLQNNDYQQRLELAAAEKQLEAAEAQLANATGGEGGAGAGGTVTAVNGLQLAEPH